MRSSQVRVGEVNSLGRVVPSGMLERLALAAEPLARLGFDATTMDDIAAATSIPRATLYYYFAGKEEILATLLNAFLEQVTAVVERAASQPGPALDRLAQTLDAQLGALRTNPSIAQVLLTDLGRVGRLPELAQDVERAFYAPVERLLHEGVNAGELAVGDPETVSRAVVGAVMIPGLHFLVRTGRVPRKRVRDEVTRLLLFGLGGR